MSQSHGSKADFLFLSAAVLFLCAAVMEIGNKLYRVERQVWELTPPEPTEPAPAAARAEPEGMTPIRIVPAVKRTRATAAPADAVKRTRPKAV